MAATRELILLANASRAASATGATFDNERGYSGVFYLNVVSCTGGSDALDVKIQDSPDGTTWYDVVTFTQATAATSERKVLTNLGRFLRAIGTNASGATAEYSVLAHINEA
jgi:hypothetical protein